MLIDLQLHSTYSDGYLTPTQLAAFASKAGVKAASLTDHNTLRGLGEFEIACRKQGIKFIPGLELYAKLNHKRFNLLWFNFEDHPGLHKILRESQLNRKSKVRKILDAFRANGFKVDSEKIMDQMNYYIPINKLIDELLKETKNKRLIARSLKNSSPREEEIIKKFFNNKKNYLRESYIDIHRIIKLKRKVGGQIVLNHPGKYSSVKPEFIYKLKRIGVEGIEVLSPHHSVNTVMQLQYIARKYDLIETGGSDFHRLEGNNFPLQHSWQYYSINSKYLRGVEKIIG